MGTLKPVQLDGREFAEGLSLATIRPHVAAKILAAARLWWLDRVPRDSGEVTLMHALAEAWPVKPCRLGHYPAQEECDEECEGTETPDARTP